jgi:hypothetical protein
VDYPFANSRLFGDGRELLDRATGGNDTLIDGARSRDEMWGDALLVSAKATTGRDTFVFAPVNGRDIIHDFTRLPLAGRGGDLDPLRDGLHPEAPPL